VLWKKPIPFQSMFLYLEIIITHFNLSALLQFHQNLHKYNLHADIFFKSYLLLFELQYCVWHKNLVHSIFHNINTHYSFLLQLKGLSRSIMTFTSTYSVAFHCTVWIIPLKQYCEIII
jgi:hypothetical protein